MVATARTLPLSLSGSLAPLEKMARAAPAHIPARRLGGWATVWALLGADGQLRPVVDRDGQTMDCAAELAGIDWSAYLRQGRGFWNASHDWMLPKPQRGPPGDRRLKIGIGTALEFHDAASTRAQQEGKVGWWTSGHLWDPDDPESWRLYTDYVPTANDLKLADHFWRVAQQLTDADRVLGFSVDGRMRPSPCGNRIIWAGVGEVALAEVPNNPAATVEVLEKAHDGSAELVPGLRPGQIGRDETPPACGDCRCGPRACGLLRKSFAADAAPMAPESFGATARASDAGPATPRARLQAALVNRYSLDEPTAAHLVPRILAAWKRRKTGRSMDYEDPIQELLNEADQVLAKGDQGDVAEILAAAEQELAKGGDEDDEEMAKDGEQTSDEDTSDEDTSDEDTSDEDSESDDDAMEKAARALAALEHLPTLLTGIADLTKSVEAVAGRLDGLGTRLEVLEKAMPGVGASLTGLEGAVAELRKSHAGVGKSLVEALRGLNDGMNATQELVKGFRTTPTSPGRSPAADNAAALRLGIAAAPADELAKAKEVAVSAFEAGRITSLEFNAIVGGTADVPTCRKAIGA